MPSLPPRLLVVLDHLPAPVRTAVVGLALALGLLAAIEAIAAGLFLLQHPDIARSLTYESGNVAMSAELMLKAVPAAFVAAMGVPIEWSGTLVATRSGEINVLSNGMFPSALALLAPAALTMWIGHRNVRRGSSSPGAAVASGLVFVTACWGLVAVANGQVGVDAFLHAGFAIETVPAVLISLAWGVGGCLLGRLVAHHEFPLGLMGGTAPSRRLAVLSGGAVCTLAVVTGTTFGGSGGPSVATAAPPPGAQALQEFDAAARGPVDASIRSTGRASFIRADVSLDRFRGRDAAERTRSLIGRYDDLFGARDVQRSLRHASTSRDEHGLRVRFDQVFRGVPVYGASATVNLTANARELKAVSNNLIPNVAEVNVRPSVSRDAAVATARHALPDGELVERPTLAVFAGEGAESGEAAVLAWMVGLADDRHHASNTYAINAGNGRIAGVIDRTLESLNRLTYDGQHGSGLPGALRRSEGQGPIGDREVDTAHAHAGETYSYYQGAHGRDSFDGNGAALVSTVRHNTNYRNAFWNGRQMVYGDGFAVKDVTGHEITHAVTERTARLEYRSWSGAVNESMSDVFGAMIDRDDWLLGEDLPNGAIRDMSNPAAYDQPDHVSKAYDGCQDNGGVHINSGIPNRAFVTIANETGKDKAERSFYRALTRYLGPSSNFKDLRFATMQAARELYGANEEAAIGQGFDSVGVTAGWQNPPSPVCLCGLRVGLTGATSSADSDDALAVLYRVRDELLPDASAGAYLEGIYEENTTDASNLLLSNPELREEAGQVLEAMTPGLEGIMDGNGEESVVSAGLVDQTESFLENLAAADRDDGGGELAQTIEDNESQVDLDHLTGMTFDEAWDETNTRLEDETAPLQPPLVSEDR